MVDQPVKALRILLVEPWWAGSHQVWASGYQRASGHRVGIVSLPGVGWRWRLRAGAVPLTKLIEDWVGEHGQPDALLVSGLVDVAQLLGFTRRTLAPTISVIVYQHESQLVYRQDRGRIDDESVLRNWQSWCVADRVVFNSAFHRDQVVAELGPFLERQIEADQMPMLDEVVGRFEVVHPGIELVEAGSPRQGSGADGPRVLWPHRWEPDKEPAAFLSALRKLRAEGLECRLVLAGDEPFTGPSVRDQIAAEFADWVDAVGPFERDVYRRWVGSSDIVVSCAKHELFGLGVAEAMAAGCRPVVPDALSYPELIGEPWRHLLYPQRSFGTALAAAVAAHGEAADDRNDGLAASMERFGWSRVAAELDQVVGDAVAEIRAV